MVRDQYCDLGQRQLPAARLGFTTTMSVTGQVSDEHAPLLPSSHTPDSHGLPIVDSDGHTAAQPKSHPALKITFSGLFTLLFISAIVALVTYFEEGLPNNPDKAALSILESAPVIVSATFCARRRTWSERVHVLGRTYWYVASFRCIIEQIQNECVSRFT
jgi:hypothetical protein